MVYISLAGLRPTQKGCNFMLDESLVASTIDIALQGGADFAEVFVELSLIHISEPTRPY